MAVALVAAVLATEISLAPSVSLPRVFTINGHPYAIENGVARDMLKAGMIVVASGATHPEHEQFLVTRSGFNAVLRFLGRDKLVDLGVLDPD